MRGQEAVEAVMAAEAVDISAAAAGVTLVVVTSAGADVLGAALTSAADMSEAARASAALISVVHGSAAGILAARDSAEAVDRILPVAGERSRDRLEGLLSMAPVSMTPGLLVAAIGPIPPAVELDPLQIETLLPIEIQPAVTRALAATVPPLPPVTLASMPVHARSARR